VGPDIVPELLRLALVDLTGLPMACRHPAGKLAPVARFVQRVGQQGVAAILNRLLPVDTEPEGRLPEVVPGVDAPAQRLVYERIDHVHEKSLAPPVIGWLDLGFDPLSGGVVFRHTRKISDRATAGTGATA
jgi:hypothetical protein